MKLLIIFGTRPEAIKLAPVIRELKNRKKIKTVVCTTGQHRQMLDHVLNLFNIKPDIDLEIMQPEQTLSDLTSRVIKQVDGVLKECNPDLVIVQGDTTTIMATVLACFYNKVQVGHVEAGLRSNDLFSPFPEEMNRKVAGILSSYHFAPTEKAAKALIRENIDEKKIFITGNTIIDALQFILKRDIPEKVKSILRKCGVDKENTKNLLILVTAHRRENFGQRIENICYALNEIVECNKNVVIVFPVHLNPEIQETVYRLLKNSERIFLIEPVEYDVFSHLMSACKLILTDSGGVQEEAPSLGKPVLVMRTETERPEGIDSGTARLIGPHKNSIVKETEKLLHDQAEYEKMARVVNPYGDGKASKRIVDIIENNF